MAPKTIYDTLKEQEGERAKERAQSRALLSRASKSGTRLHREVSDFLSLLERDNEMRDSFARATEAIEGKKT